MTPEFEIIRKQLVSAITGCVDRAAAVLRKERADSEEVLVQ